MIVIGSNTSDNGPSCLTADVSHFMELRQNRQLALLKRSAKKEQRFRIVDSCTECSNKKAEGLRYITPALTFLYIQKQNQCHVSSAGSADLGGWGGGGGWG